MNIYLDMDGVLCNWTKGVLGSDYPKNTTIPNYFARKYQTDEQVRAKMKTLEFWTNLEPYAHTHRLVEMCKRHGTVSILTKRAFACEICKEGKQQWMSKYYPELLDTMQIVDLRKADESKEPGFLIDDNERQIKFWRAKEWPCFKWTEATDELVQFHEQQLIDCESAIIIAKKLP